MSSVNC